MTAREFAANVGVILTVMALLYSIELVVPLFARDENGEARRPVNLGLMALTLLLNWALISLAAVVSSVPSLHGPAPIRSLGLPMPAVLVISVAALDLSTYLAHVGMHKIPALWRVHRVHHSDPFLDVTTTFRQHPLEGAWRFLWILVPVWIFGLPAAGVAAYRLLSAINGVFEHANIRLWTPLERILSLFWATPNMHKIHHSRLATETNSNYGNIFALFDRGFRTFTPTDRAFAVVYGLQDDEPIAMRSFSAIMASPFTASR